MSETESPKKSTICFVDTPLLDVHDDQAQQRNHVGRWMEKVVDMVEVKEQIKISVPMMLTSVFYYLITLVSVMFAGHLGELQLAGATLANSWATVTGFALMIGLSGALETLCGQEFGAREYRMLGIHLQASCFISILFSGVVSILWLYTETILLLLHQDHEISKLAALYVKYLIPGIFAYAILQCIMRFLQAQSVVMPLVLLSVTPLILHFGITYSLVNWTSLGLKGAPLAASISLWISVLFAVLFIVCSENFKQTWEGLSTECFNYIFTNLKLALPSAAMVCLEYWAFEILVFLAGLMPDSEISTSLIAMCVNTETIAYMIICGLSAAASTRVSNELGAGHPDRAKNAMAMSIKLSFLFALFVVLLLVLGNSVWAHFFSDNLIIIHKFASMTPFLAISILLDSIQGVLSGVARGCGWQHLAVCVNLSTFYLIGVPIACVLGFKLKLFVKGLWMGLICGLSLQAASLLLITKLVAWTKLNLSSVV